MQPSISRASGLGAVSLFAGLLSFTSFALSGVAEAQNRPPQISGSPAATVSVNSAYTFTPSVRDPDTPASRLRFSIINKPWWTRFNSSTGALTGTPRYPGAWGNIRIAVSDGRSMRTLPAFKISASSGGSGGGGGGGGAANRPPVISGAPATTITPGSAWSFTPTANDPDGDRLTFSIANRPTWASFSTSNGRLSGTPASSHVGAYSNIRISVSDGEASRTLPAFGITVSEVTNGSATLSWSPPTSNTNGSSLTNLAGYRIYYGTSANALNRSVQIANAGVATYVIDNLSPATWYFAVRAYTSAGAESSLSNVASKTVR